MAKEVSSNTANATLEAGDYFGFPRNRLLPHIHNPEELNRRLGRVDWCDYLPMCREMLRELGSGPELVTLGQEFLRYKFKTRNAHFYAQFSTWDKALWVTKHYMAERMIRGYAVDYEKLGPDFFHVTMTLDESLEGDSDFLYFLIGTWTGSSTMANLDNRIENLVVTPNRCEADIQFDSRSFASRAVHNPVYCRWKTWRELRRDRREQADRIDQVSLEQKNLSSTLGAVSDAVFDLKPEQQAKPHSCSAASSPSFFLKPDEAIERLRQTYQEGLVTEEQLEITRNRLRTLFDAVSDGLLVFHKGELLLANREGQRMLNVPENRELSQAVYEAGLRSLRAPTDSGATPETLERFPHLLIRSCTLLQLEEGRSYLVSVSDLSRARELSEQVEELSTQERRRIARDLHDGLSQLLSSLSFQAKALALEAHGQNVAPELERIATLADRCLKLGAGVYHELDQI
jgi:PAS domain-containing protein